MNRMTERLKAFADRSWYAPLVGVLAAIDQFILIIPIEWLMLPNVMLKPRRWLSTAFWVTTGCALGSALMAMLADRYGLAMIQQWAPRVLESTNWNRSVGFIQEHGAWALLLMAMGPLPQHPAVILSGLSHMPSSHVFLAVWVGRMIKYCVLMYMASHAPKLLERFFPVFTASLRNAPAPTKTPPNKTAHKN